MHLVRLLSRHRSTAAAIIAALCVTTAAPFAQGKDWASIVAAAKQEGRVVLYSNATPPMNERMKAAFEAANPDIKLETVRLIGIAVQQKLLQEKQSGLDGGDLLLSTEPLWMEKMSSEGLLTAPSGPAMRGWPAKYLLWGNVPVVSSEPFVMAYNADLVKQRVAGYPDLLRPEFGGGKIGTSDLVAPVLSAWYDWLEKTQGPGFLQKLAAQHPKLYGGATQAVQATASGEVSIAPFAVISIAKPLIQNGAHLQITVPNPSIGNQYMAGIANWTRRPNASLVLLDFLMSEKGQMALCGNGEMACPLPNIPGALNIASIGPYDPHVYTPEFVKNYTDNWNNMFKPH